jgi:small subunit ribosomal protein S17
MSAVATGSKTRRAAGTTPRTAPAPIEAESTQGAGRRTKVGRVVSDKMDKTIVVSVERLSRHPVYKRVIRLTTKFKAHDEANEARLGDTVLIQESRPLSATKRWRLVRILSRAGEALAEAQGLAAEEDATFEAIHMAAHPGRDHAAAEAAAEGESEASAQAAAADAEGVA